MKDVGYINSDGKYVFCVCDYSNWYYEPIGVYISMDTLWLDENGEREEEYPYYVTSVDYSPVTEKYMKNYPQNDFECDPYSLTPLWEMGNEKTITAQDLLSSCFSNSYKEYMEYHDEFEKKMEGSLKNEGEYYDAKADALRAAGVTGKMLNGRPLTYDKIDFYENQENGEKDYLAKGEAGSVQREIYEAEKSFWEYKEKGPDVREMRLIWDKEIDHILNGLKNEMSDEEKEKLLAEQEAWKESEKEHEMKAWEEANEIGDLFYSDHVDATACVLTRERVFVLAQRLAEIRGESFDIRFACGKIL